MPAVQLLMPSRRVKFERDPVQIGLRACPKLRVAPIEPPRLLGELMKRHGNYRTDRGAQTRRISCFARITHRRDGMDRRGQFGAHARTQQPEPAGIKQARHDAIALLTCKRLRTRAATLQSAFAVTTGVRNPGTSTPTPRPIREARSVARASVTNTSS